jgi:hypothetical protein
MPFITAPGRHIDAGNADALGFGFRAVPRETSFEVGERGVENGCAAEVLVAAGRPSVRGLVGVGLATSRWGIEEEKGREKVDERREDA